MNKGIHTRAETLQCTFFIICDHFPEHPLTEILTPKPVRFGFQGMQAQCLLSSQEPDKPLTLQSCSSLSLHGKAHCSRPAVAEEPPERVLALFNSDSGALRASP